MTAVLLQITQHAESIAALHQREAARYQHITSQFTELAAQLAQARDRMNDITATAVHQAAVLDGLDRRVVALATRLTQLADDDSPEGGPEYQLVAAPRWWALDGPKREDALARLRAWVSQVYRTGYGHLAARLGSCWEQHPLCLYGLDWLMEL